jgi:hypothetical protein
VQISPFFSPLQGLAQKKITQNTNSLKMIGKKFTK